MNKMILASMMALVVIGVYPVAQSSAGGMGAWDHSSGAWDHSSGSGWSQDSGRDWNQSDHSFRSDSDISEWTSDQADNKVVGAAVRDTEGRFLGVISDFATDPDGRTSFAILSFGRDDEFGEGGRLVAVPFDALSCYGQECTLDSTYDQLASSPVFLSKDDLSNRQTAGEIYQYFGIQPFWTEDGTMGRDRGQEEMFNNDSTEPDFGLPYRLDEQSPSEDMGQLE